MPTRNAPITRSSSRIASRRQAASAVAAVVFDTATSTAAMVTTHNNLLLSLPNDILFEIAMLADAPYSNRMSLTCVALYRTLWRAPSVRDAMFEYLLRTTDVVPLAFSGAANDDDDDAPLTCMEPRPHIKQSTVYALDSRCQENGNTVAHQVDVSLAFLYIWRPQLYRHMLSAPPARTTTTTTTASAVSIRVGEPTAAAATATATDNAAEAAAAAGAATSTAPPPPPPPPSATRSPSLRTALHVTLRLPAAIRCNLSGNGCWLLRRHTSRVCDGQLSGCPHAEEARAEHERRGVMANAHAGVSTTMDALDALPIRRLYCYPVGYHHVWMRAMQATSGFTVGDEKSYAVSYSMHVNMRTCANEATTTTTTATAKKQNKKKQNTKETSDGDNKNKKNKKQRRQR